MLELKVRKFGNSLGVVLPKEALQRLRAGEGERLFLVETSAGAYELTPYDPGFAKKMSKVEDIASRYRNTLRALSK
ncbi:MAG: AbrB family transcriptional regulator [Bryobacteraceae bacterium]